MPSTYFSSLRTAVRCGTRRCFTGQEGGSQDSVEILLGQGKLLFGNSRLFHSTLANFNIFLRPGTIFAARSDSVVNQRRNLSVVGALSRTFSIPSVSGPSFQVCGYHIDLLLSDPSDSSIGSRFQKAAMAASGSRSVLTDRYLDNLTLRRAQLATSTNNGSIFIGNNSFDRCRKVSMSLKDQEKPSSYVIYGYFTYNIYKRSFNSESYTGSGWRYFHGSSSACISAGTAPDVSFDNSAREEQLASSTVSSEQKILMDRTMKLVSGSCCLPHPDKEETGGEDAHFICENEQAIGVADGVGGWADLGVDAGQFSRELMSNSVNAIQEEPKGSVDPARVLEKAHSSTKAKGSSTACIIALTDQGLHAINLGDSGFMVVRDGCTIFRSPVQQHNFNFTYQLESGNTGDLPSSGQVFIIPVAPGDVMIAGTDGLFDNLYNNEVTAVVVHATRAGLGPQVTAQKIAALARQRAQDKNRQTPFSTAAQDAGFRYYGGKLDDITVIVSYITSSSNENSSAGSG
ncbi:probable protein phosphatase 2C 55 isoform X3 [Malania oleifera]|uniref:probable protein phosphatase 2C 55 isoform X2 n=1 Tax=Malania oleifera TaxID=397392 RepID=UPI0025AE1007|nr:probable protein phosphatase 2C 55 isoform X2 [Malania oleifera]XP_057973264.1 probable protein phosphatase 2C 55 isoform X2 [Malania oleifera]XP_057973265.1 probable protein phosphatase 2C 55 isoform X2 [Malania oleifera]XP_057973266.1 probable protein phosphatase 2C 55 isoform X3 [Malania oleifera]XP_057973267.1 probable protein phosphatase 2C 55 isoform X3 [Malania oleifera]XP_057973268.1 probable protein phosphatase 2C 55 isoform X3 [Malania oleifera]